MTVVRSSVFAFGISPTHFCESRKTFREFIFHFRFDTNHHWDLKMLTIVTLSSVPESSDALSGVRMFGRVCSTSTWISSVSSVFFRFELFFWPSSLDDRGLFLSLLFLLSPGSLRSSRSRVEDRTVRR